MRGCSPPTRTVTISTALALALIALASMPDAAVGSALRGEPGRTPMHSPTARFVAAAVVAVARDLAAVHQPAATALLGHSIEASEAAAIVSPPQPGAVADRSPPLHERLTSLPPPTA